MRLAADGGMHLSVALELSAREGVLRAGALARRARQVAAGAEGVDGVDVVDDGLHDAARRRLRQAVDEFEGGHVAPLEIEHQSNEVATVCEQWALAHRHVTEFIQHLR